MARVVFGNGLVVSIVVSLALSGCAPTEPPAAASILLFNGTGTSPGDVAAAATILKDRGIDAVVNRNIHKAAVPVTFIDGQVIENYWEDGPQFTGWGLVVAKYPDGTPAIVQGTLGEGSVILRRVHPEAPESWRRGLPFTTSAKVAHEYAGTLVDAALHGKQLPHY